MAKILIIEDHASLGQLYQTVLHQLDHEVTVALTGEAGVEAASRVRPDLVIVDLLLPGISGVQAVEKLKLAGILPATPLVVTTAMHQADAEATGASLGAAAVLVKPFDINAMLASVQQALSVPGGHAESC